MQSNNTTQWAVLIFIFFWTKLWRLLEFGSIEAELFRTNTFSRDHSLSNGHSILLVQLHSYLHSKIY